MAERVNRELNDFREKQILLRNIVIIEQNSKAVNSLVRGFAGIERGADHGV